MTQPKKFRPLAFLGNLLLDLALIGVGVVLYLFFAPEPQRLAAFLPGLANLVGGAENLVRLVAGLPLVVGGVNLLQRLVALLKRKT